LRSTFYDFFKTEKIKQINRGINTCLRILTGWFTFVVTFRKSTQKEKWIFLVFQEEKICIWKSGWKIVYLTTGKVLFRVLMIFQYVFFFFQHESVVRLSNFIYVPDGHPSTRYWFSVWTEEHQKSFPVNPSVLLLLIKNINGRTICFSAGNLFQSSLS